MRGGRWEGGRRSGAGCCRQCGASGLLGCGGIAGLLPGLLLRLMTLLEVQEEVPGDAPEKQKGRSKLRKPSRNTIHKYNALTCSGLGSQGGSRTGVKAPRYARCDVIICRLIPLSDARRFPR